MEEIVSNPAEIIINIMRTKKLTLDRKSVV